MFLKILTLTGIVLCWDRTSSLNFFFTFCWSLSDESEFISDVAIDEEESLDPWSYRTGKSLVSLFIIVILTNVYNYTLC